MNTGKKQKTLKNYFNFDTAKGRKAIVIASVGAGLVGGYIVGHYGNENITGNVATYYGGSVTRNDLYEKLKNNTTGSGLVKSTLILEVFGKEYGKSISDETVKEALSYYEQTGYLSSSNANEREEVTKKQLAFEKGLMENLTASNKEMEEAFSNFRQPVTFSFVGFSDKETADEVLEQINNGKNMTSVSSESVIGTGEKLTYTNAYEYSYKDVTNILPDDVLNDLYQMKTGDSKEVSYQVIDNSGNKQTYYYVLKVYDIKDKGDDWTIYKDDLSRLVKTNKMNSDNDAVNAVIAKEFTKYRVKINDNYMKKALSDYME